MTIRKIQAGRITSVVASQYVGEKGTIFYNESSGSLRLSDGITTGGINILGNGGSALTVKYNGSTLSATANLINFTGDAVYASALNDQVTVNISSWGNLDGGTPTSNYGGINNIDGGHI
jgi:hypothetical protein